MNDIQRHVYVANIYLFFLTFITIIIIVIITIMMCIISDGLVIPIFFYSFLVNLFLLCIGLWIGSVYKI